MNRNQAPYSDEDVDKRNRLRLFETLGQMRKYQKLSQKRVAGRMETQQSAVSDLEAGRADPRLSTIQKLARAIGLTLVIQLIQERVVVTHSPSILLRDGVPEFLFPSIPSYETVSDIQRHIMQVEMDRALNFGPQTMTASACVSLPMYAAREAALELYANRRFCELTCPVMQDQGW